MASPSNDDVQLQGSLVERWYDRISPPPRRYVSIPYPYWQPTFDATGWNGKPTLHFVGHSILKMDDWSDHPVGVNASFTVLAVVMNTAAVPKDAGVVAWWTDTGLGSAWTGFKAVGDPLVPESNQLVPELARYHELAWAQVYDGPHDVGNLRHVIAWRYSGETELLDVVVDGTRMPSAPFGPIGAIPQMPLIIGATSMFPTGLFTGDISEILIFREALEDSDIQDYTEYARQHWTGLDTSSSTDACRDASGAPVPSTPLRRCDDDDPDTYGDSCSAGSCIGAAPLPHSPAELDDVAAWYHAGETEVVEVGSPSSRRVSTWFDRTTNRLDLMEGFYAGRPQLIAHGWNNGPKPVIRFDGGDALRRDGWTGIPAGQDSPFTVLAVVQSVANRSSALASWWNRSAINAKATCQFKSSANGATMDLLRGDNLWTTRDFPDARPLDSGPHLVAWRFTPGLARLTIDGTTVDVPNPEPIGLISSPTEFLVGAAHDLDSQLFQGDIAELAVVTRAISDAELANFGTYAQNEWGGLNFPCQRSCDDKAPGQDNGCGEPCGNVGGSCSPNAPCARGLFCQGDVCVACPAPCTTVACDTADVCGVTCGCGTQGPGQDCVGDSDCDDGLVCGTHNGACFGGLRAHNVCWPAVCADGVDPGECGSPESPCGENCACVTECPCPPGEECKPNLGAMFGAPSPDVCLPAICPSDDPAYCGEPDSLCGVACICTPDCSQATCANPDDHCGHSCPGVCDIGQGPCTDEVVCKDGGSCPPGTPRVCREPLCATAVLRPPLCGHPGATCGDECPTCTPACGGKECGIDPVCGQSCGTCGQGMFCDGAGQCRTPNVTPPATGPGDTPIPNLPRTLAFGVGAIPGSFNVTPQGSADYSVPIVVPPGRAGLEPSLSLHYVGSRLDGDAGVGWRVEGFSTIARCPRIHALDGGAEPIKNDSSDVFCVDGKRLWKVGSGTYGANNVVYHTPVDGFSKVVSYVNGHEIQRAVAGGPTVGVDQQGPDYFKIWAKDGRILTYGRTPDSLIVAPNGVRRSWLLNKVEDRSRNTILINYENFADTQQSFGEALPVVARPSKVAYTGHDDALGNETAGTREVRFTYQTRPDQSFRFMQGGLVSLYNERLTQITTYVNNAPVRNYSLKYRDTPPSQLEELRECEGGTQFRCKPATKFGYAPASANHFESESYPFLDFSSMARLDVDGDSKSDFLQTYLTYNGIRANTTLGAVQTMTDITASFGIQLAVASGAISGGVGAVIGLAWTLGSAVFFGSFAPEPVISQHDVLFLGTGDRPPSPPVNSLDAVGVPCLGGGPMFLLDFDRDGKDDFGSTCGGTGLYMARWNGTRFDLYPGASPVANLDMGLFNHSAPIMLDVNGDSLQDILYCKDKEHFELQLRVSTIKPDQPTPTYFLQPIELARGLGGPLPICDSGDPFRALGGATHAIFDVDGDGTQDLIARDAMKPDWHVLRYALGEMHWERISLPDAGQSPYGEGMTIGDYNGDGLADVTRVDGRNLILWINTGHGGFVPRTFTHPAPADSLYKHRKTAVFDYDNDGNDDLVENWSVNAVDNLNQALRFNSNLSAVESTPLTDIRLQIPGGNLVDAAFDLAADLDGDGATDLFGRQGIFYGIPGKMEILSSIVDGLGNQINIHYDENNHYSAANCPGTQWPETCLKRMTGLVTSYGENVVKADGTGSAERGVSYKYENGRMNVTGHGWLGFDKITESETFGGGPFPTLARETVTEYEAPARYDLQFHQLNPEGILWPYVYPLTGMPKTVTVTQRVSEEATALEPAGGHVRRTRTINSWEVGLSSADLPFPKLGQAQTKIYDEANFGLEDGAFESACFVTLNTDSYGNVYNKHTSCDIGEFTDTVTQFAPDENTWLIGNPELITITASKALLGDNQVQVWDPEYQNGVLTALTRSPNDSAGPTHRGEYRRTEYHRNNYGNPYEIVESVRSGEAPRTTFITYDDDEVFPTTITKSGQTTQVRYDDRFGTLATAVDPNRIAVQRGYDGLGLLSESSDPGGTTIYTYTSESIDANTPAGTIRPRVKVTVDRQGTAGTHTGSTSRELDSHARVVRTTAEGFNGATVVQESAFDARGRLSGSTLPHATGDGSAAFTTYQYDGLDRLTLLQHSDGTYAERQYASTNTLDPAHALWLKGFDCTTDPYSFACALDIVNTVDESGHRDVLITDRNGLVLRNVDGNNFDSAALVTTNLYDGLQRPFELFQNAPLDAPFSSPYRGLFHDAYGRLSADYDSDVGYTIKTYNGYDELKTTQDPATHLRTFAYDDLGRVTSAVDDQGTTTWLYDVGVNAIGRLTTMISPATAANPEGQRIDYSFELFTARNRGLLNRVDYTLDGVTYSVSYDYDDLARTRLVRYPDLGNGQRVTVRYGYDPSGALSRLERMENNIPTPLWNVDLAFEGYQVQQETFGNQAQTTYGYDPARHWLHTKSTTQNSTSIQALTYTRYDNGQIHRRASATTPGTTVDYGYDALGRLESASQAIAGGPPNLTAYQYDDYGNITQKGLSGITYEPTQPHIVDTIEENTYHYNANGNVISRTGPDVPSGAQTISYTPFNLPDIITTGTDETRFEYSADQQRLIRRDSEQVTYFVPELYQRRASISGATQEERFRLYAGSRMLGEIVRKPGLPEKTLYFHTDAIDTVATVSASDGSSPVRQTFDPFGGSSSDPSVTRAGFTGQDHDRDLGLIDMRGRIYDPLVGRFVSPDPLTQNPFSSQGLNRYSYVFNDPINSIDPSGYFSFSPEEGAAIAVGFVGLAFGAGAAGAVGGLGGAALAVESFAGPAANAAIREAGSQALQEAARRPVAAFAGPSGTPTGGPPPPYKDNLNCTGSRGLRAGNCVLSFSALFSLAPLFARLGVDLTNIYVDFGYTGDASAYTVGNHLTIDKNAWDRLEDKEQRALLAHEITHTAQYNRLGYEDFFHRYAPEHALGDKLNYGVPPELQKIPIGKVNVIDSRFTLDQIGDRFRLEILRGP